MDNLRQFYEGRTVVISAHRLSTVRDADQIIVMNGGKILVCFPVYSNGSSECLVTAMW